MPWSKDHKTQTRKKIVDAAAASFRAHGAAGVGLADVMHEAGLTHGGFYAHFKSKDDLIAAALKSVNETRLSRFDEVAAARAKGSGLDLAVDTYLSSRHREHPESGCVIATLGRELARERGSARHQIGENARAWLERFAQNAPAATARGQVESMAIVRRLSTNRIHTVSRNSPRLVAIKMARQFSWNADSGRWPSSHSTTITNPATTGTIASMESRTPSARICVADISKKKICRNR